MMCGCSYFCHGNISVPGLVMRAVEPCGMAKALPE